MITATLLVNNLLSSTYILSLIYFYSLSFLFKFYRTIINIWKIVSHQETLNLKKKNFAYLSNLGLWPDDGARTAAIITDGRRVDNMSCNRADGRLAIC